MKTISLQCVLILLFQLCVNTVLANPNIPMHIKDTNLYDSNDFAIGVGFAIVKFDTNIKVKKNNRLPYFLDLEGNLDLPEISHVTTVYGKYRFNEKHNLYFAGFSINRRSQLIDFNRSIDDISLSADLFISDKTRFYNLSYGYTLFNDDRSNVTLIAGINGLDLHFTAEASGQITILGVTESETSLVEASVFAPLPLAGLSFGFKFTPKWSMSTMVSIVSGSYENVSASIMQTTLNMRYKITEYTGLVIGLSYFDSDVEVKEGNEITDISYGYDGGVIGMHFLF